MNIWYISDGGGRLFLQMVMYTSQCGLLKHLFSSFEKSFYLCQPKVQWVELETAGLFLLPVYVYFVQATEVVDFAPIPTGISSFSLLLNVLQFN